MGAASAAVARHVDRPGESAFDQQRQAAEVIGVGMREENRGDWFQARGKGLRMRLSLELEIVPTFLPITAPQSTIQRPLPVSRIWSEPATSPAAP